MAFPTLVFYETSYSLYVTIQASRRAWRIIQTVPCKTYFPYYTDSMEARAVALIGRKQRAAKLLYGESDIGLSEFTAGDDAGDLIAELARSLDQDEAVTDLRDLFKAASHEARQRESLWLVDEPIAVEDTPEAEPTPPVPALEATILATDIPLPAAVAGAPLPAREPARRRRKVRLSDAPDHWPTTHPAVRVAQTMSPSDAGFTQLGLFDT